MTHKAKFFICFFASVLCIEALFITRTFFLCPNYYKLLKPVLFCDNEWRERENKSSDEASWIIFEQILRCRVTKWKKDDKLWLTNYHNKVNKKGKETTAQFWEYQISISHENRLIFACDQIYLLNFCSEVFTVTKFRMNLIWGIKRKNLIASKAKESCWNFFRKNWKIYAWWSSKSFEGKIRRYLKMFKNKI